MTRWILVRDIPPATAVWLANLKVGRARDPQKCDHRPAFNGDIWFCRECGEPVVDGDRHRVQSEFTW